MKLGYLVTKTKAMNDLLTQAILNHYGKESELHQEFDDSEIYVLTPQHPAKSLFILGDDSWGVVIGFTSSMGHLVLCADYGDDGTIMFSATLKSDDYQNPLVGNQPMRVNKISKDHVMVGQPLIG